MDKYIASWCVGLGLIGLAFSAQAQELPASTALTRPSSISFYKTTLDQNDIAIVNADVMSYIHSLAHNLLSISPPMHNLTSSVLRVEETQLLTVTQFEDSEQLSTYSQISHELGVCGGYARVSASDLARIQGQLLEQRNIFEQESREQYAFTKSTSPTILSMLGDLNQDAFKTDLHFITQFPHRNARQSNNTEIEKIKQHIQDTLPKTQIPFTMDLISHNRIPQKSIHIQIPGTQPDRHIVLGGHIDSINMGWGSSQAPGADDNASGSTAILQILRAILKHNYQPQNTLNFFWYAGEELGLIGSADIAKRFRQQNIDVIAALQLDMLGVPDQAGHIYLEQDFSSPKLNQLLQQVAQNYFPQLVLKNSSCGYPCSDHSSWYQERYPVTFPTSGNPRGQINRLIHTARDLPSTLNWDYALSVTRLSLAFILTADKEL